MDNNLGNENEVNKEISIETVDIAPKKKWKKILFIVLTCLAVIILIVAITVFAYVSTKLGKINYNDGHVASDHSVDISDADSDVINESEISELEISEPTYDPEPVIAFDKDVINILLLGTDERAKGFSDNARADSIMLMSVNTKDYSVKLVSIQRGIGALIPWGQYEGEYDWITHCFRYGGAAMMMEAVQNSFNVQVDYYIRANFGTFTQFIDKIGGVDIELTSKEAADMVSYGFNVHEGMNHLDGAATLRYSRTRFIDSDWVRIERQRKVIKSAFKQCKNMSFSEINSMLNECLPLVMTNMPQKEILNFLGAATKLLNADIDDMTLPVKGSYGIMYGLVPDRPLYAVDFATNSNILKEFLYGSGN